MCALTRTPDIFEYRNYRDFLRDFFNSFRDSPEGRLTLRDFSRRAGFSSPSFIKLVIDGKRNLSHDSIEKLASAMKLTQEKREFFAHLVLLNQAKTVDEKRHFAAQLLRSRPYRKLNPLKEAQFDYFTHWYYIAIRELVGWEDFQEDPEWIAKRLVPQITAAEARQALDTLQKLGHLSRNERGRLEQTQATVATGDDVFSASLSQFHREMIQKASESIDRVSGHDREISSLTFGVSEDTARELKEMIQKFRRELTAVLLNSKKTTDSVYQLNFQLFPLAKKGKRSA